MVKMMTWKRGFKFQSLYLMAFLLLTGGCNSLLDVKRPSDLVDPDQVESIEGAIRLYKGAVSEFTLSFAGSRSGSNSSFAYVSGMFSDEYQSNVGSGGGYDTRNPSENERRDIFVQLSRARLNIDQAIGALKKFPSTDSDEMQAELYAMRGYTYIMIAELFCSGVPFSRAPYEKEPLYGGPLTTMQMLDTAIMYLDSTLSLAGSDDRLSTLALVGKGRAYLNQGALLEAEDAVQGVPTESSYAVSFNSSGIGSYVAGQLSRPAQSAGWFMASGEGQNGLSFGADGTPSLSDGNPADPRVAAVLIGPASSRRPLPSKFGDSTGSVVLADGIEARLIEAESRLATGSPDWLTILNGLRTSGFEVEPSGDTVWLPGEGGVGGLPTLSDPALEPLPSGKSANDVRVDLVFKERAYWMFGTGHRVGDLRRLVRQYGRTPDAVYPVGVHSTVSSFVYARNWVLETPLDERDSNPNYNGCSSLVP